MEALKEALLSRNIVAWAIVIVLFVLFLKLLQSAGKGLVLFLLILGLGAVLYRYFPGVIQPLVDFVQGGWLGEGN